MQSVTATNMDGVESVSDALKRSPTWFDDGNVVLQAEDTQFRVHRTILAANSPIFRDMFSIPQPSTMDGPLVEGCPVVHLQDKAIDVQYMLSALYQRDYQREKPSMFAFVAALLRLGTKYEIHHLRKEATSCLYTYHPHIFRRVSRIPFWGEEDPWIPDSATAQPALTIDTINLARDTHVLSILPHALYSFCCHIGSFGEVFDSVERQDGSRTVLSPADQRLITIGREKLIAMKREIFSCFDASISDPYTGSLSCSQQATCAQERAKKYNSIWTQFDCPTVFGLADDDDDFSMDHFCRPCASECRKKVHDKQVEAWETLPALFELPSWEELLEADDIQTE